MNIEKITRPNEFILREVTSEDDLHQPVIGQICETGKQHLQIMRLSIVDNQKWAGEIVKLEQSVVDIKQYCIKTSEDLCSIFEQKGVHVYGCFNKGVLMAWGYFKDLGEGIFNASSIVIAPEYRQKGIGKLISGFSLQKIKILGGKKIQFTVHPDNTGSIALSENVGGVVKNLVKNRYGEGKDRLNIEIDLEKE